MQIVFSQCILIQMHTHLCLNKKQCKFHLPVGDRYGLFCSFFGMDIFSGAYTFELSIFGRCVADDTEPEDPCGWWWWDTSVGACVGGPVDACGWWWSSGGAGEIMNWALPPPPPPPPAPPPPIPLLFCRAATLWWLLLWYGMVDMPLLFELFWAPEAFKAPPCTKLSNCMRISVLGKRK